MIKILSLWSSRVVLRFLKDNEKKLFRNSERTTLKLERNKSHLTFKETCYNNCSQQFFFLQIYGHLIVFLSQHYFNLYSLHFTFFKFAYHSYESRRATLLFWKTKLCYKSSDNNEISLHANF